MKLVEEAASNLDPEREAELTQNVIDYVGDDIWRIWWVTSQALDNDKDGTALAVWQNLRLGVAPRRPRGTGYGLT